MPQFHAWARRCRARTPLRSVPINIAPILTARESEDAITCTAGTATSVLAAIRLHSMEASPPMSSSASAKVGAPPSLRGKARMPRPLPRGVMPSAEVPIKLPWMRIGGFNPPSQPARMAASGNPPMARPRTVAAPHSFRPFAAPARPPSISMVITGVHRGVRRWMLPPCFAAHPVGCSHRSARCAQSPSAVATGTDGLHASAGNREDDLRATARDVGGDDRLAQRAAAGARRKHKPSSPSALLLTRRVALLPSMITASPCASPKRGADRRGKQREEALVGLVDGVFQDRRVEGLAQRLAGLEHDLLSFAGRRSPGRRLRYPIAGPAVTESPALVDGSVEGRRAKVVVTPLATIPLAGSLTWRRVRGARAPGTVARRRRW